MSRTAIVLFNLGGPDRPESVEPFLFNLFNDPAIIGAPTPIRRILARYISKKRGPVAREIYDNLGGGSPLLANTEEQAGALDRRVQDLLTPAGEEVRSFIAMRYWHPMAAEAAAGVKAYAPDRIVLLPLYPQFSTTTVGSSFTDWDRAAEAAGLGDIPATRVCCYPMLAGYVEEVAGLTASAYETAGKDASKPPRVLFSAHGLPKKVIRKGDPYQWQVEQSAAAVVRKLGMPDLDWQVCYQSRVGPLEWIGPDTESEVVRAAEDGVPIVLVPIAFVSEHSETLVELDIEYRDLADRHGAAGYHRVPTVDAREAFIGGLADLAAQAARSGRAIYTDGGQRICPAACGQCPQKDAAPAGAMTQEQTA